MSVVADVDADRVHCSACAIIHRLTPSPDCVNRMAQNGRFGYSDGLATVFTAMIVRLQSALG
jgi:hypothetical protein